MASDSRKKQSSTFWRTAFIFLFVTVSVIWLFGLGFGGSRSCAEKLNEYEGLVRRLSQENHMMQGKLEGLSGSESKQVEDLQHELKHLKQELAHMNSQVAAVKHAEASHQIGAGAEMQTLKKENEDLRAKEKKQYFYIEDLRAKVAELSSNSRVGATGGLSLRGNRPPAKIGVSDLQQMAASDAIAVVVIACKRPQYLTRALNSFLKHNPDRAKFPIIVSQDGFDGPTAKVIDDQFGTSVFHMNHEHEQNAMQVASRFGGRGQLGYVYIAQHYGFALRKVFDEFGFKQLIFLEEDMEVAPDFFSYFGTMLPILRNDANLYCVSAWNDNGYASLVRDPNGVYRTDFFPGLGWMLEKSMWDEVRNRWPDGYWDEFMRRPDVRHGRQCIRPEISRDFTFGEEGTSGGQFFSSHLSRIKLNDVPVAWENEDLSRIKSVEAFDAYLQGEIAAATEVNLYNIDEHDGQHRTLRIVYNDAQYGTFASKFTLMADEKEGIRRMSYRGVIPFTWQTNKVYLHTHKFPQLS